MPPNDVLTATEQHRLEWHANINHFVVRYLKYFLSTQTTCLHFTAGCMNTVRYTTGWVSYTNEPSSSAGAGQPGRLWRHCVHAHRKVAVWTVDVVAHLIEIFKRRIIIYSFLCSVAYDPKGWQKLDRIQNSIYKTLLQIFKTFRTASYTTSCTTGCKVYMDLDKWHTSPQEWTLTVCISSACLPNFLNVRKHYTNSLSHLRAKWTKTLFCMDSTSTMQNASYWVACWIITLDVLVVSVKHLSGAVAKNSCREKPAVCLVSIQVVNAAAADAGYCEGGGTQHC